MTSHVKKNGRHSRILTATIILGLTAVAHVRGTSWGFSCQNGMTVSALRPVTLLEAIIGKRAVSALPWNPEDPKC